MNRNIATNTTRKLLDDNNLKDWHVRLTTDITKSFVGLCSHKDKCIILNAHHVDTHPEPEVINTIRHEVAHALTPDHGHDSIWADKARELGCDNTLPCMTFGLSPEAIDAIRSGADLKVEYEEQVIRTPKYTVTRLQDKCPTCGKVAKEKARIESHGKVIITLECLHILIKDAESRSKFEDVTFDGDKNCKHTWNKTVCVKCNAKKLFPFQVEGARALERANGRFAIFDEMGLGKTIQPLAYLRYHEEAFPLLWITKSGIKFQHGKEIIRVLGDKYFPQVLSTGKDKPMKGFKTFICSYDLFRRQDLEMWKEIGIQTVVLDECQAIKNPDSSRTQCIRRVVREIPRIIPLSGTPWKNRGSEFFVVLNMLDPIKFYSYQSFINRWVDYYWDGNKYKEGGIRRPKEFKEYIAPLAIRRERTEVMPELPLINRMRLLCEVPEHARKVYNEERDKIVALWNEAIISGEEDSFETQQSALASLIIMRQVVGLAKVDTTVEFVKEFLEETDRKIVVFLHHKKCGELILNQLTEFCKAEGYPTPLSLTASMNSMERFEVQEKFNSPNYKLLIASTLASGEGLNLQTCSDMVQHERQWNPANEEQVEGRFIRIGQTAQSVNATYVHGDNTIDTILDDIVESKRVAFHNAMNKGEIPQWNETSIIKELAAALAKEKK